MTCFRNNSVHDNLHCLCSATNKGESTVNYYQYLVFDHPHLSCNDHDDWWISKSFLSLFPRKSFEQS